MGFRARTLQRQMSQARQALNRPMLATAPKTLTNLLIVHTLCVDGPRGTGISHYEIHVATDDGADAPVLVLLTRDLSPYRLALDAEGSARRFDVTWHASQRPNGEMCRRLDTLTERTPTP